ncbi:MAG: ATP-binding protein [Candidatus Methanomethylophilaceae archaeon]
MIYQNDTFFGREPELSVLEKCYGSEGFGLVTVSGQSGIGKTALLRRFCSGKRAVMFSAMRADASANLNALSRAVSKSLYRDVRDLVRFNSMDSALEFIYKMSEKGRLIFVIDNYDDLAASLGSSSEMVRAYLTHIFPRHDIMLILAGSGGFDLSGMKHTSIELDRLTFSEVCESFPGYRGEDLVALYGVTGGYPSVLRMFDGSRSIRENVDRLFLMPDSPLYEQVPRRLTDRVRTPETYISLLSAICDGPTSMKEITSSTAVGPASACSTYLASLIDIGIVTKENPFHEPNSRKGMYRITDDPLRFWVRFIYGNRSLIDFRGDEDLYAKVVQKDLGAFLVQTFRDICVQFIGCNPASFDIHPLEIGSWRTSAADSAESIDIVVGSGDHMSTMFCSCRYGGRPMGIDAYNTLVRRSKNVKVLGRRTYALFSSVGFTDAMVRTAEKDGVYLTDLSDLSVY